jgi:hypothetical protein
MPGNGNVMVLSTRANDHLQNGINAVRFELMLSLPSFLLYRFIAPTNDRWTADFFSRAFF